MRKGWDWLKNYVQADLFAEPEAPVRPNPPVPSPPNSLNNQPSTPPNANTRTLVLGEQVVRYRLERSRRKTVGMMIDAQGLRVRAAAHVPVAEIERILRHKASWILRHLNTPHHRHPAQGTRVRFMPDLAVVDGQSLKLLGRSVRMAWGSRQALPDATAIEPTLTVARPRIRASATAASVRLSHENAVANALGEYLCVYLQQRAQWYAAQFGLRYHDIALSNAKTLWGTCRRDGLIRMNWRLVFLDEALVDYVLAHELAHTVHMNHSAAFWAQVERMCPDYRALRRQLKQFDLRGA